MPTFEEALRATVSRVSDAYQKAETDLKREVEAAALAVAKMSNHKAVLDLRKESERKGTTYFSLRLYAKPEYYTLTAFAVPGFGYPIRAGDEENILYDNSYLAVLDNAQELHDYFVTLASNPDSALVLRLAMLLRQSPSDSENGNGEEEMF